MAGAYTTTVVFSGLSEFTNDLRRLRNEFRKLDGAKATITINVKQGVASQPMVVDAHVVERALTQGMRLEPTMLADYINNGRILPDKMFMFIEGLNRELMKEQTANRGRKTVIKDRETYKKIYGRQYLEKPRFLYFNSKVGQGLNVLATDALRSAL